MAQLHVCTWKETYGHLLPDDFFSPEHLEQRRRMWAGIVQNPSDERRVAVAESEGSLVGFAVAGPARDEHAPRDVELNMIYVPRSHHGTGVGQALLDAVLADRSAFLWVAKDNPRAQVFYRRNGFTADGTELVNDTTPVLVDIRLVR